MNLFDLNIFLTHINCFFSLFQGTVINQKHELHKRCEANRAYAHYRFLKG